MFRKIFRLSPIALFPTLAYLALLLYVYSIQDRLAYYPIREHAQRPADYGIATREHTIVTADGERLHAWFIPGRSPYTLLYSHGNGGNLSYNLSALRQLNALGPSIFIYDYRGYGRSTGRPDEAGLYLDALAAYEYARQELNIPADRLLLHGRSLGGAMAVHLATTRPARGLILEATFTSAVDVGAELYWYLPVSLLARHRFESRDRLRVHELTDVQGAPLPVLILHSRQDRVIPFDHAPRLFEAARTTRKTLVALNSGGHNDANLISRKKYEQAFVEFLQSLDARPPNASVPLRQAGERTP